VVMETSSLKPPVQWRPTTAPAEANGEVWRLRIPPGNANRFFKLECAN
jgi:hypothetical protein